ncbi:histone-lysine N-methyltransferase SETMAR [Trichonephila clavipes]|nr:histone-lysine N-methyltransferase SETMAR [Trichonephila clavipes]
MYPAAEELAENKILRILSKNIISRDGEPLAGLNLASLKRRWLVEERRDWKGIIYYELLPNGQTLNSDIYCPQLDHLKPAIDWKWPELANRSVVFHQDNARVHTSVVTRHNPWDLYLVPIYLVEKF